jgi:hypothetical protein
MVFNNIFLSFEVLMRLNLYFFIFIIILLPEIISLFEKKSKYVVSFIVIGGFTLLTIKTILNANFFPYDFNLNIIQE